MHQSDGFRDRLRSVLEPVATMDLHAELDVPPQTALAAVLAPIVASERGVRMVFTKRTDTLSRHAGEISFPGGLLDHGEEPATAALREAEEELGLKPSDVDLLGALPPVHTHVSGILILPFVGWLGSDLRFSPNEAEIADILEFPLSELVSRGGETEFEREGRRFQTYVYEMDGHTIWGATARILHSFIELMDAASSPEDG
jgi:8-oxo-dGTP pyrophosphatase MutT (NUDIX family)